MGLWPGLAPGEPFGYRACVGKRGYWTTWFSNCQPQADQPQVSGNGWPGAGTLHSGIGRKRSAPRSPRRG